MVARCSRNARTIVAQGALLIEAAAKRHASGRPGPNVVTGSHRRSFMHTTTGGAGEWSSLTGPTMVYSRRLELGFDGTDSLGRTFHQPPYPSLGPGVDDAVPQIARLAARVWGTGVAP